MLNNSIWCVAINPSICMPNVPPNAGNKLAMKPMAIGYMGEQHNIGARMPMSRPPVDFLSTNFNVLFIVVLGAVLTVWTMPFSSIRK